MTKREKIKAALLGTIANGTNGASWGDIRQRIEADKFTVKNWMTQVRSPLQELINENQIARTDNVHEERYVLI